MASFICQALREKVEVIAQSSVGGGCINCAFKLELADGRRLFIKTHSDPPSEMFRKEAVGLEAIAKTGTLRVPRVLGFGPVAPSGEALLLEWIEPGNPGKDFFEVLGRQLAELHRQSSQAEFGFPVDNFLGSSPQPNTWRSSWAEFFASNRIEHQLRLADSRYGDPLRRPGRQLVDKIPKLLNEEFSSSLIHGDLWSGNYFADQQGNPVLVDPATYFGAAEAEFGMTRLFGGMNDPFEQSYQEILPFEEGFETRVQLYILYHLLNHLNLFGGGYLTSCLSIINKFV